MHELPYIIIPLLRVNWRILVRDTQRGVSLDQIRAQIHLAPCVVHGLFAVKQFERHGVDAYGERDGEVQRGGHTEGDAVGTGFEDRRFDEEEGRAIEDILGDSGDTDQKAVFFC